MIVGHGWDKSHGRTCNGPSVSWDLDQGPLGLDAGSLSTELSSSVNNEPALGPNGPLLKY